MAQTRAVQIVGRDDADDHQDHHEDVKRQRIDEVEPRQKAEGGSLVPRPGDPERKRGRIDAGDPIHPAGPVPKDRSWSQVAEDPRHDLAEPQRHDRQVVASQPQRRCPEERPKARGGEHADEEQQPERQVKLMVQGTAIQLARGEHPHGVGTNGEEGGVAEVEKPCVPDDDVQPDGEENVDACVGGLVDEGAAATAGEQRGEERKTNSE